MFSSDRNYAGLYSHLEVEVLPHRPLVQNWRWNSNSHWQHVRASCANMDSSIRRFIFYVEQTFFSHLFRFYWLLAV